MSRGNGNGRARGGRGRARGRGKGSGRGVTGPMDVLLNHNYQTVVPAAGDMTLPDGHELGLGLVLQCALPMSPGAHWVLQSLVMLDWLTPF